jgi:hypothetical protein
MDLGHLQWLEANSGRTPSKRDPKGEKPMCSNFITVPRDMRITNFSALRVSNGVSDGVSMECQMEYWSIGGPDRGPQTALNLFTILGNGPCGT